MGVAEGVRVANRVGDGKGVRLAVGLLWVAVTVGKSSVGEGVAVGACGPSSEQPAKISKIQEMRKIRFIIITSGGSYGPLLLYAKEAIVNLRSDNRFYTIRQRPLPTLFLPNQHLL